MTDIVYETVQMPIDVPEMDAKSAEALKLVIQLLGGDPAHWKFYVICEPLLDGPVDKIYPGGTYKLLLQDNEEFEWPKSWDMVLRDDVTDAVIARALACIGFPEELACNYFIALRPNGRSIYYEGDGILHPGRKYFLRPV